MKVALCLYGFYNNRSDKNAGDRGYKYIQDKIINHCIKHDADLDIFFHCWELGLEDKLVNQFKPIDFQFEKPHNFSELGKMHGIEENLINEGFNRNSTIYKQCTINSSLSFYYSRSNSLNKAINYANKNNFKYYSIISSRFDLGQRSTWHKGYNVSLMDFNLNLDMEYIYSAMWKQLNAGLADQWFFSNQENMKNLSSMYELALKEYFLLGSDYEKSITGGWIDSNAKDITSNEVLKNNNKSTDLIKYPRWQMINNHIIHKWHFIKTGLYEKSRYIGDVRV